MSGADDLRRSLRRVRRDVYYRAATLPLEVAQLSASFGGDGEPITAEQVEADFGPEAARAWLSLRAAGRAFKEAAKLERGEA